MQPEYEIYTHLLTLMFEGGSIDFEITWLQAQAFKTVVTIQQPQSVHFAHRYGTFDFDLYTLDWWATAPKVRLN